MRKMGGLYRYMPITWITSLCGSLALIGFPLTSGFFSKDGIIEAVHESHLYFSGYAYASVLSSVFVTALYSFRLFFMTFHGKERIDWHHLKEVRESPKVVTVPLILLAIPSLILGAFYIGPALFQDYFGEAIFVLPQHDVLEKIGEEYHGIWMFTLDAFTHLPVYLSLAGVLTAYLLYIRFTGVPEKLARILKPAYVTLMNKYWCDAFNQKVFAGGFRGIGRMLWQIGDVKAIDGVMVNGTAAAVRWISSVVRTLQSGYLYDYAFAMIIGLLLLLGIFVHGIFN